MSRRALLPIGGVLVVFLAVGAFLVLRGQGGGGTPRTLDVTVSNAAGMSPDHLTARQGDTITMNVHSDRSGEVHLHGYDIHFETKSGGVVTQTFRADKTGDFEIEWESTSTHLGNLVVSP
jgi:hypothetical protein